MPEALTRLVQEDFSGGIVRTGEPERIPANGVYDLVNGFIDPLGGAFKRGGTVYRTDTFGTGLRFLWDGWLASGGQQTVIVSTSAFGKKSGTKAVTSIGGAGLTSFGRAAVYEGILYFPGGVTYDGATLGSVPSFGAAADFYATVSNRILAAKGTRVYFSKFGKPGQLPTEAGSWASTDYHELPSGVQITGIEGLRSSAAVFTTRGLWLIGGLNHNLVDADGNVQQTLDLYSADFVLWGPGGIAGWQGGLVVPATDGVYLLELGVSSEKAAPFVRLSDPIAPFYRTYVEGGYSCGQATVFQNRYMLPILAGSQVVDMLVCHLDLPHRPWTRLQGMGARMGALATRVTTGSTRSPELIGAESEAPSRTQTLSYLTPSAVTAEANNTGASFSLTTRSYATGNIVPNLIKRLRLRYLLAAGQPTEAERRLRVSGFVHLGGPGRPKPGEPKIRAEAGAESPEATPGSAWGVFVWGVGTWSAPSEGVWDLLPGEAPVSPDGFLPYAWHPNRKRRFARFRFSCAERTSELAVRSIEIFVRPSGRL